VGVVLIAAVASLRRSLPIGVTVVAVGGIASVVGLAQYASLPAETGPRLIWWIPTVVATACGIGILALRSRAPFVRLGLVLVAASQLIVWAWVRRLGLVRGVLPTSTPFWIDRAVTVLALAVGIGLLVIGVVDLIRLARQEPVARSMAAPSSL
jgi:predicted cobalt transporter CbtA